MKKFIKNIFLFVISLLMFYSVSILLIPKKYYQTIEYSFWEQLFDKISDVKKLKVDKINIVVGDSRSQHGLNCTELNAINFSLGGATPVEGYYILDKLISEKHIDTVYLAFGQFHFYHQDCFFERSIYYNFIDKKYLSEVINMAKKLNDKNYIVEYQQSSETAWLDFLLKSENSISYYIKAKNFYEYVRFGPKNILANLFGVNYSLNQFRLGYETFHNDIQITNRAQDNITLEQQFESYGLGNSEINKIYLNKIIELCKENNIEYYFIIFPLPENSIKPNQEYFDYYENYLKDIFGKKLIEINRFWPNHYFKDMSHLNKVGVEKFTNDVKNYLIMQ